MRSSAPDLDSGILRQQVEETKVWIGNKRKRPCIHKLSLGKCQGDQRRDERRRRRRELDRIIKHVFFPLSLFFFL